MTGIGKRIEQLLSNKNLKKVEFADILNINQSYVTQLIKEKRNPSERLIEDICEKFSIRREWLVDGNLPMEVETTSQTLDNIAKRYHGSKTFRVMLDVYARLEPDQQDMVERFVEMLADEFAATGRADEVILSDYLDKQNGEHVHSDQAQGG